MSRALLCDECGTSLPLNARGEHDGGEDAGWIFVHLANARYDLCTRSCAHAFLDSEAVVAAHDEWLASITGIARVIRGEEDDES